MRDLHDHIEEPAETGEVDLLPDDRSLVDLKGRGVSPGIAIGPAYVYARNAFSVEHREIAEDEVEPELERFEWAVSRSERDLGKISALAREKLGEDSSRIFDAQLLMLRDSALYEAVLERIRHERSNADYSVMAVMTEHRQRMEASDNEYLRERANDLQDVQDRLITHLRRGKHLSAIVPETIVVAENLTAADIVLFSRRGILGFGLDHGGTTSHVSIMARALGVPAIASVKGLTSEVRSGDMLILDGMDGRIFINPDDETLARYRIRQERYLRLMEEHRQLAQLPAETLDKHHVRLMANVEFDQEVSVLEEYGAEGIGLVRTEMLLLMQGHTMVSEEAQLKAYRNLLEAATPHPTTIRILDLGGDKMLPVAHREHNPFLGWRGIRVLLDKPDLLVPQLRALLRASVYGPLRMLIPMVTEISEIHQFKEILEQVKADLDLEGYAYDDIQVGIMVEVPAVALLAERFATEVDFFSLGTNDLTQYTLAVDRGNDLVSDLFHELHPAVLLLIKTTIDAGKKHGIPVSLCGEMGGDPKAIPILVGLGLEEMSVSPSYLPEIKRVIRSMKRKEAENLAEQALTARNVREVEDMLNDWLEKHHCGLRHLLRDPRNEDERL